MPISRIIVAPNMPGIHPDIYTIINLETEHLVQDLAVLHSLFSDGITTHIVDQMPEGDFKEVMYHNGVIDPQQEIIIKLCGLRGIIVEAAKVGCRYYGEHIDRVYANKAVDVVYTEEPELVTLKPRGIRQVMEYFDLRAMDYATAMKLSKERDLHLSPPQMWKLLNIQHMLGLSRVTDVFLETMAAFWSDHCFHTLWKSLGLMSILTGATRAINNPNLVSAFVDNAGVWDFYDGLCLLFKLETHNSPTQSEPFGGQQTKDGGVIRDIAENGLGAKPIGMLEMTTVGEFAATRHPALVGNTLSATTIAQETVRAVASYCNPMGIPMMLARMMSHPDYGAKPFALGGTVGITTRDAAEKGIPRQGDLAVLVGGRTGNDGLHGATVSSDGITEKTDTGDSTHVQIGHPYTEQLMMRAGVELRDAGCCSARNDFGAAGVVSCFGEMGRMTGGVGGIIINLALVPLKCDGLANWQIALSESQERFGHAVKPEMFETAMAIYERYGLEATVIGIFTESGRFQMVYDPKSAVLYPGMELCGEVCLDVPYVLLDECPLSQVEVKKPEQSTPQGVFPIITTHNVQEMGVAVVGHFDVCDQSSATTQYDSTVQGITFRGPLYGVNYNVASSLAVLKPVYGKPYGATVSTSFSPWQFEVDPVGAAINAVMDAVVTQVVAGVELQDIALADNFYTDGADPTSLWYLEEQVRAIAELSQSLGTPFITGKDSSSGRGTFGGVTVKVPPSVCITAMGKVPDAGKLIGHQWKRPGNILMVLGPQAERLDGSILSASLGIAGSKLDRFPITSARDYLDLLGHLVRSDLIVSALPINRGGIFLRLFEGMEASGFGVDTEMCCELFPESFGSVLVEVAVQDVLVVNRNFRGLNPIVVGGILPDRELRVQSKSLDVHLLHSVWQKTFKEVMYGQ